MNRFGESSHRISMMAGQLRRFLLALLGALISAWIVNANGFWPAPRFAHAALPQTWDRIWPTPRSPHPAVVRVTVQEHGAVSHGSGTLIDVHDKYGLVVTNWHVIRDATGAVTVTFPDGFQSAARIVKADENWDLAALAIWRPATTPMSLASQAPHQGDVLTIAGYGQGDYREATGRCTQYVSPGVEFPYEMVEVSVGARQGDSGGPIVNQQGELAGVLFGSARGTTSGSYTGRVRWFLDSASRLMRQSDAEHDAGDPSDQLARIPKDTRSNEQALATKPVPSGTVSSRPESTSLASSSSHSAQVPREHQFVPTPRDRSTPIDRDQTVSDPVEPNTLADISSDHEMTITLSDLAGDTPWERAKSVMAIIGVFAVISYVAGGRRTDSK